MRIATMTLAVVLMATAAMAEEAPPMPDTGAGYIETTEVKPEQFVHFSGVASDLAATPTFTVSDEVSKSLKEGDRLKIVGGALVKDDAPTQAEKERDEATAALAQCQDTLREIAPMAAARARQLFTNPQTKEQ